jgi:hypothetical protein
MGKSSRSAFRRAVQDSKKEMLMGASAWVHDAEKARGEALLKCAGADAQPVPAERVDSVEGLDKMEVEKQNAPIVQTKMARKGAKKKAAGRVGKKVNRITVLSGKNQFHKKKMKGNKGTHDGGQ